jgi:predicted TIM-barrel fold metal-dependent hydrolase
LSKIYEIMKNLKFQGCSLLLILFSTILMAQKPEELYLRDFKPRSIHKVKKTEVERAKFSIIDVHAHPYAAGAEEIDEWVKTMDAVGVERTIVLTAAVGARFDSLVERYSRYPDRFELWCGIDFRGSAEPGWSNRAVRELERCYRMGARGIGEIHDKGTGLRSRDLISDGLRVDDPKMQPIYAKCAELGIPLNIHMAEPMWMYEPMDATNDGLMNAYKWRIDLDQPGILDHGQLIEGFERAVAANSRTTFIACHLLNCSHDLSILGRLLDRYPNLYADISARYAETAAIPRHSKAFIEQYQDRLLYGTDMGMSRHMYQVTLRILETLDEHFYESSMFSYHWPLYGFGLSGEALEKLYSGNARKILDGE